MIIRQNELTNSMQQSIPLEADSFLAMQTFPNHWALSEQRFDVVVML
jgi:hypothetical protein